MTASFKQALGPIPYLEGAACAGREDWFDVDLSLPLAVMHRHQERALFVCRSCPALEACREWTVPDPHADVWAQGGWAMFDVVGLERHRERQAAAKRRRVQERQAKKVRAEAAKLVREWEKSPW